MQMLAEGTWFRGGEGGGDCQRRAADKTGAMQIKATTQQSTVNIYWRLTCWGNS